MTQPTRDHGKFQAAGCMFQLIVLVIIFSILFVVEGSFRTQVSLQLLAESPTDGMSFEETLKSRHWLWGLIVGQQPDQVLAKYKSGANRLSEITVNTRHSFTDCVVSLFSLGVYTPITITLSGKVVSSKVHETEGETETARMPQTEARTMSVTAGHESTPRGTAEKTEQTVAASSPRTWTDTTGKYRVVAEFHDFDGTVVRLKKADGMEAHVPIDRLSPADQRWVREQNSGAP